MPKSTGRVPSQEVKPARPDDAELQNSATRIPASETPAADGTPSQTVPALQKKTLSGFAKGWIIFWIIGNLASACAPAYRLSDPELTGIIALFMLLVACVVVGYVMLLYKKPFGLYIVLIANLSVLFLNGTQVGNYTVTVTTGLIIGIITFFITRKQIAYPFGKSRASNSGG